MPERIAETRITEKAPDVPLERVTQPKIPLLYADRVYETRAGVRFRILRGGVNDAQGEACDFQPFAGSTLCWCAVIHENGALDHAFAFDAATVRVVGRWERFVDWLTGRRASHG